MRLLQFRHLKQLAQKAWSPVRMARSSILFPQELQLYVQLLQINEPSPRRSRCASESSRVLQVLHRKQSICHLLPARNTKSVQAGRNKESIPTYLIQKPFPLLESVKDPVSRGTTGANPENKTYFSTTLTRVRDVFLVHWGLGVHCWRFHLGV